MGNKLVWLQESYDMPIARYKCLMMATTMGQIGDSGSVCTRFPVPPNYPAHRIAPFHSTSHLPRVTLHDSSNMCQPHTGVQDVHSVYVRSSPVQSQQP